MTKKKRKFDAHDDQEAINHLLTAIAHQLEGKSQAENNVAWALIYSCLLTCYGFIENFNLMKLRRLHDILESADSNCNINN